MADYVYSISGDLSNGLDPLCLHNTIEEYGFSPDFKGLLMEGDVLTVMFEDSLSGGEENILDSIISEHDPDDSDICPSPSDIGYIVGSAGDGESSGLSSTNSTSPQTKLTLQITELPEGRYRIGWYYEWAHSKENRNFNARVQVDNTTDLMEHIQEAKEVGTDQSVPVCGYSYIDLTEGDHFIDLDFWTDSRSAGGTAYIKNAKLEIWRTT